MSRTFYATFFGSLVALLLLLAMLTVANWISTEQENNLKRDCWNAGGNVVLVDGGPAWECARKRWTR